MVIVTGEARSGESVMTWILLLEKGECDDRDWGGLWRSGGECNVVVGPLPLLLWSLPGQLVPGHSPAQFFR